MPRMSRYSEYSSLAVRVVRAGMLITTLLPAGCHGLFGGRSPRALVSPLSPQMVHERLLTGAAAQQDMSSAGDRRVPGAAEESADPEEKPLPAPRLFVQPDPPGESSALPSPAGLLTLPEAIAEALDRNPRLRVAQEQTAAARAGEDVAFAPFLPQVDFSDHYAGFNVPVLPAAGFVPAGLNRGTEEFNLVELGLQWTLLDFGRTAGRYGQAVTQTEIAELRLARARQTVAYEVAAGYFQLLLTQASRRVREQALQQSQAILKDTRTRFANGVVDRDAVLRAEVENSENLEAIIIVQERVLDAEARLNLAMGRGISLPVQVVEVSVETPFHLTLQDSLEQAVEQRLEIGIAQKTIAEAQYGEQAAHGEFMPKLYVRGSVIRADGQNLNATVMGAGIHLDQSLYGGGRRLGDKRRSEALVRSALAGSQVILDNIALEVNIAYRAIAATRNRIRVAETAVAQARENLRLINVKYQNGDATPTDIVDAQTALTRAQMRYFSSLYEYLTSLARLDYATGGDQSRLVERVARAEVP